MDTKGISKTQDNLVTALLVNPSGVILHNITISCEKREALLDNNYQTVKVDEEEKYFLLNANSTEVNGKSVVILMVSSIPYQSCIDLF